jgi:hypothetical protein
MRNVMYGASKIDFTILTLMIRDRLDKRVQLFVTEVSNSPVQIIEQNVYARPEVSI